MSENVFVRVGHLNIWSANKSLGRALQVVKDSRCHSFGLNEAGRVVPDLRTWRDWRLVVGRPGPNEETRRGGWDTPIVTRDELLPLGEMSLRISERVAASARVAPDRWLAGSFFESPVGPVAHLNVHLNAAVKDQPDTRARVVEYSESVESLSRAVAFLRAEGFSVVVSGDVNYAESWRETDWSPYVLFGSLGFDWRSVGVDVIAWSPDLVAVSPLRIVPKSETGSNHPGLIQKLGRK